MSDKILRTPTKVNLASKVLELRDLCFETRAELILRCVYFHRGGGWSESKQSVREWEVGFESVDLGDLWYAVWRSAVLVWEQLFVQRGVPGVVGVDAGCMFG